MTDLIIWNAGILCLWASLVTQLVKNPPAMQETLVQFLGWKFPWRWDRLPTPGFLGFPGGSVSKESVCNAGDLGSIYGLGRFPTEGHSHLLQYSFLENPHGQRSLVSYSPWDHRLGHEWATKHSTEITTDLYAALRKDIRTSHVPFIQFPPMVTFWKTLVQYHSQKIDTDLLTISLRIFPQFYMYSFVRS